MKKLMLFASAVALVAFSSCTNEDALVLNEGSTNAESAISFSAYTSGASRASDVDLNDVETNGFGVFAYSTGDVKIADYIKTNYTPNFMYNQKVDKSSGSWAYAPIKYWPNNPGAMVSFYAYAPYIPELTEDAYTNSADNNNYLNNVKYVDSLNVALELGKDYMGPGIHYIVPADPTHGVDLLWGEYKATSGELKNDSVKNTWGSSATDATNPFACVNATKFAIDQKVNFQFHHALSRLHFNIQVWNDTIADVDVKNSPNAIDDSTTIFIDKVELVGKFPKEGVLRLYDGTWNVSSDDVEDTYTFSGDQLNPDIIDGITKDEASKEIDLLKGKSMEDGVQLDDEAINNFIMALPTKTQFFIRITYTVVTKDGTNPKNNSTITNVVCSNDKNARIYGAEAMGVTDAFMSKTYGETGFGMVNGLQAGYAYDFHLNIGMTTVKFDANVDKWTKYGNEVDLPQNYEEQQSLNN